MATITPDSLALTTGAAPATDGSTGPLSGYTRSSSRRVSLPTSSISAETRSDCPMWWTYMTSTAMLTSTSTNAVTTAIPGTLPVPSPLFVTSRRARMACTNVATNRPIANWLGLSRRIRCTIRGENWPIASWTTTIVIVSTSAVRLTIDAATVERITVAASGSPARLSGSPRSRTPGRAAIVANETAHASEHAQHGHEPQARAQMDQQLRDPHAPRRPTLSRAVARPQAITRKRMMPIKTPAMKHAVAHNQKTWLRLLRRRLLG